LRKQIARRHGGYADGMPTVIRKITAPVPPDQVINYLKDFAHAEEWDAGTQQCTRNDAGPIEPGASWHNVSKIFGLTVELTYTLDEVSDDTLVFVGTNRSSTSRDTITVGAAGRGSEVTYRADLSMRGPAKLLNPVMKLVFEKLASDTEKQLSKALNGLGAKQQN
jgi:carbon monoxide dehydrogenase subunit G